MQLLVQSLKPWVLHSTSLIHSLPRWVCTGESDLHEWDTLPTFQLSYPHYCVLWSGPSSQAISIGLRKQGQDGQLGGKSEATKHEKREVRLSLLKAIHVCFMFYDCFWVCFMTVSGFWNFLPFVTIPGTHPPPISFSLVHPFYVPSAPSVPSAPFLWPVTGCVSRWQFSKLLFVSNLTDSQARPVFSQKRLEVHKSYL